MSPTPARPTDVPALPAPAGSRLSAFRDVLLHSWPGRLLLLGLALKAFAWSVRLLAGREPLAIALLNTAGSIALIAAAFYFVYKLVARARRRLLWRVRRKLIVSYIFIGVVPALLIVSFFVVSGVILFLNVAGYLVQNGFTNITNEAAYFARLAALEIQRGPGVAGAGPILAQREATLALRYPGASIALVPTIGDEPCVGGPAAGPHIVGLAAPTPENPAPARPGRPERVQAMAAGPWEHQPAPTTLPTWVSCAGFGGVLAEPIGSAAAGSTALLTVRGVGLPDAQRPTFAVIVDIPKNDTLDDRLRSETTIKVGGASIVSFGDRGRARRRSVVSRLANPPSGSSSGSGGKRRFPWVAYLDGTDWQDGSPVSTAVQIEVNIADIYDRLSSAQVGQFTVGSILLGVLLLVAVLFLLIEAAALLMGLALARSITGSVHQLFTGTARVRQGDFSHRIEVKTHDQLGELAESFNQMTGSIEDLLREAEEKKRLEEELRIAREIQMSLLPRGKMAVPGLSISALCVPAREVGGDYYDFLPLDEDRLGVLIADVSGKGTSAALYMAELKGLILSLSRTCRSPRQLMLAANEIISKNLDSRSFITMTYAVIDLAAQCMTYARAGHTPLIYRSGGNAEGTVQVLVPDGLVLGLRIDGGELFSRLLQEVTLPLGRGDLLMFFTDGISEAMNPDSDLFGDGRLARLVAEHGHLPPDELRERILREIDAFVAGAPQHDDMTMILLKFDDFVPGAVAAGFADGRP